MTRNAFAALIYKSRVTRLASCWRGIPPFILFYHGVIDDKKANDWTGKHTDIHRFASHLEVLSSRVTVLPVEEMVEELSRGRRLKNTAAITFDDGYENNAAIAAPLLKAFQMPASFFLSTGYVEQERWMWTDELEHTLSKTSCRALMIGAASVPLGTVQEKVAALLALKKWGKLLSEEQRAVWMREIMARLQVPEEKPYAQYRFMNWAQVRELSAMGFSIGAHTVNHPILSKVSAVNACAEIEQSRQVVIENVGTCSEVFCYPNGKLTDFTEDVVEFCRSRFIGALSTIRGVAKSGELFRLRRIGIDNSIGRETLDLEIAKLAVAGWA